MAHSASATADNAEGRMAVEKDMAFTPATGFNTCAMPTQSAAKDRGAYRVNTLKIPCFRFAFAALQYF
jgi:hypothetical protein